MSDSEERIDHLESRSEYRKAAATLFLSGGVSAYSNRDRFCCRYVAAGGVVPEWKQRIAFGIIAGATTMRDVITRCAEA